MELIWSFRRLDQKNIEEALVDSSLLCKDCSKVSYTEFTNYLHLDPTDLKARQLFRIYDTVNILCFHILKLNLFF